MNNIKKNNILTGLLIVFVYGFLQAQGIDFKMNNWEATKSKTKEENKLIFVDAYTTWCGPCKRMDKYVFSDEKVGNFYNTNFISFKIDTEKGEGPDFAKTYDINSYPTFLFIDSDGKLFFKKEGAMNVDEFLQLGQKVLDLDKEVSKMTAAYNIGNREPEFILKYLAFLKERGLPTEEIALWYFTMIEKDSWTLYKNQKLVSDYMHNPYNKVMQFYVTKKEPIDKAIKSYSNVYVTLFDRYDNYIKDILIPSRNDEAIDRLVSNIDLVFYPNEAIYLKFLIKKETYKRDKDWDNYTKLAIDYVNNHLLEAKDYLSLNNWAMVFYNNKNITDKNDLNAALKWITFVVNNHKKDNRNFTSFLDTQARVLYKLGRKREAHIVAKKAIKIAKNTGNRMEDTIELIEEINAGSWEDQFKSKTL